LILGIGMPTTANYVVVATLLIILTIFCASSFKLAVFGC
jgi:TRAP-type uncharacterized transport system fused permease subunit